MKSRRGFAIQRLMNAMRQAHADGWFIVFDTLTLADDRLEAFYDNPNALRGYFRDIGRMVLAAEGRKPNDSHADCYQYFCVHEYVTANGHLHFHAVFFFSSIRRHTIFDCDWSSDVCSSDLTTLHDPERVWFLGEVPQPTLADVLAVRSEERRVGKECRYRWSTNDEKKKK